MYASPSDAKRRPVSTMWALKFSDADVEEEFMVLPLVDDCEEAPPQGGKEFLKM